MAMELQIQYLKVKIIYTLCRTSGSFMCLSAFKIQWCTLVPLVCLLCICTPCFYVSLCLEMGGSEVQWLHWPVCTVLWPVHWSGICSFLYCVTSQLKSRVPFLARSRSVIVFCVVQVSLISVHRSIHDCWELDSRSYGIYDWEWPRE
jgi:hypothetical protein